MYVFAFMTLCVCTYLYSHILLFPFIFNLMIPIVWSTLCGGKMHLIWIDMELTRNSAFKYCFSSLWSIQKQAMLGETILKEICWMDAQFEVVKNLSLSKVRSFKNHVLFILYSDE